MRRKSSLEIKLDALKMARRKTLDGCAECADGYLKLAGEHGATPDEILAALNSVDDSEANGISRRAVLYGTAAAGISSLLVQLLPSQRAAATDVASTRSGPLWLASMRGERAEDAFSLTGIRGDGTSVVSPGSFLALPRKLSIGSTSQSLLYSFESREDAAGWQTALVVVNATDGSVQSKQPGLLWKYPTDSGADALASAPSPDGSVLAVVHSISWLENSVTAFKGEGAELPVVTGDRSCAVVLEVFAPAASKLIGATPVVKMAGDHAVVNVVTNGNYVLIGTASGRDDFRLDIFVIDSEQGVALVRSRVYDNNAEPLLRDWALNGRAAFMIGDLAFLHGGESNGMWLALASLEVEGRIELERREPLTSRPFPDASVTDGKTAYLYNAGHGRIHAVDLDKKNVRFLDLPVNAPRRPESPLVQHPLALLSDGRLAVADSGMSGGGIWVVSPSTMAVQDRWLSSHAFEAVVADGDDVVAIVSGGTHALSLDETGAIKGAIGMPAQAVGIIS